MGPGCGANQPRRDAVAGEWKPQRDDVRRHRIDDHPEPPPDLTRAHRGVKSDLGDEQRDDQPVQRRADVERVRVSVQQPGRQHGPLHRLRAGQRLDHPQRLIDRRPHRLVQSALLERLLDPVRQDRLGTDHGVRQQPPPEAVAGVAGRRALGRQIAQRRLADPLVLRTRIEPAAPGARPRVRRA